MVGKSGNTAMIVLAVVIGAAVVLSLACVVSLAAITLLGQNANKTFTNVAVSVSGIK
jgi:hypothetical protein